MIDFEFLSDQNQNFPDSFRHSVNYEDMNLNVSIPVFSIHGNHDDVTGTNRLSSMDILSSTGLLNYFGKWTSLNEVEITPIVLQKKETKVALYGLSHIHDARLARLFRDHKVKIRKPDIPDEEIFNLMVVHQNRADRGRFNYLPEDKLPGFLDFVLWGHEHDCRIEPEQNPKTDFYVSQPGSSVATSLSEGESIDKKIGILEINRKEFKMTAVNLKTVRPFIFRSVNIEELAEELELNIGDTRTKIEKFLVENVEQMIEESKKKVSGHKKQPTLPLIRLRILYTNENHSINTARFGQKFDKIIANPESMLTFKKNIKRNRNLAYNPDEIALKSAFEKKDKQDNVEDVVESYFNELENEDDKLKLFSLKSLSEVCRLLVDKDDDDGASRIIQKHFEKAIEFLGEKLCDENTISEALQEFQAVKSNEVFNEALVENSRASTSAKASAPQPSIVNSSDDEEENRSNTSSMKAPTTRGRGRGRGGRGAAAPQSRATKASLDSSGSGDGLNVKRTKAAATKQITIAQATQRSQRNTSKKAQSVYINSSDSE